MTEPEIDPEMKKYIDSMLAYEEGAYNQAMGGDFDGAIAVWSAILNDSSQRDFFAQVPEALDEIYWNTAVAYWGKGDEDSRGKSRQLIADGGLSWDKFQSEVGADA